MVRNILNSVWDFINSKQQKEYGLAEIYDSLVSHGYFDYDSIATAIKKILGTDNNKEVLELAVGSGNLAICLANTYKMSGVDRSLRMIEILTARFEQKNYQIDIQQNELTEFNFKKKFDCIYLHSADPMIFWDENNKIELAINSRDELWEILKNIHFHLKPKGELLINIEKKHSDFPERFDANLFIYKINDEGGVRKIYEILDRETGKTYWHTTLKEKPCSVNETNAIFKYSGFSSLEINENRTLGIFTKV